MERRSEALMFPRLLFIVRNIVRWWKTRFITKKEIERRVDDALKKESH